MNQNEERPRYIIKVERDWRYGPRARFWYIQEWRENDEDGYWTNLIRGLAYTEWGMRKQINRALKKLKFGTHESYFSLDGQPINKELL